MSKFKRYTQSYLVWAAGPTHKLSSQFTRYALVTGIAYAADILILIFLMEVAGFHYLSSNAIAYLSGLVIKYFFSIKWVFGTRSLDNKCAEFVIFAFVGIIGLGFNQLFMVVFIGFMQLNYLVSKLTANGLTVIWNFSARKFLLFR